MDQNNFGAAVLIENLFSASKEVGVVLAIVASADKT
jgi:hypothetical protein